MTSPYNQKFWTLVKKLVVENKSKLEPCKFYAANTELVNKEYKLSVKKTPLEYGVSSRFQK